MWKKKKSSADKPTDKIIVVLNGEIGRLKEIQKTDERFLVNKDICKEAYIKAWNSVASVSMVLNRLDALKKLAEQGSEDEVRDFIKNTFIQMCRTYDFSTVNGEEADDVTLDAQATLFKIILQLATLIHIDISISFSKCAFMHTYVLSSYSEAQITEGMKTIGLDSEATDNLLATLRKGS